MKFRINYYPIFLTALLTTWLTLDLFSQEEKFARIMFYNVENLFDTKDDSLKIDEEFLPDSERHWDNHKFYTKLNHIYKVIIGVGEWEPPAIVGLCEIENRYVLNKLVYDTPLKTFNYKIVHYDSPDERGIDVAMIYRPDIFSVDTSVAINISFPFDPDSKTRDILYVRGRLNMRDTLHVFVNHWPSRYGGYIETQPSRNYVAGILKSFTDSLLLTNSTARVIIMGDLNDDPTDESVMNYLKAKSDPLSKEPTNLYNLMTIKHWGDPPGTLKYKESWNIFDQIIVSGNLIWNNSAITIGTKGAQVFTPDFLFEDDDKYLGRKPFRTYIGFKYNDGYSDHLPVFIDLISK